MSRILMAILIVMLLLVYLASLWIFFICIHVFSPNEVLRLVS